MIISFTCSKYKKGTFMKTLKEYVVKKNQEIFPIKIRSWTIYDEKTFIKEMDKSTFVNHGSGIPIKIRRFFDIEDLDFEKTKPIRVFYNDRVFDFRLVRENEKHGRTRMFWKVDFEKVIKERLPEYHEAFANDETVEVKPVLRFNKMNSEEYIVSIISPHEVEDDFQLDEENGDRSITIREGKVSYSLNKVYKRNQDNRKKAIEIHGTSCKVCGFDFMKTYGELGRGFIEIHHIKPLSTFDEEETVDPRTDLVPLCANCHRMVHRKKEIYSIDEIRVKMGKT